MIDRFWMFSSSSFSLCLRTFLSSSSSSSSSSSGAAVFIPRAAAAMHSRRRRRSGRYDDLEEMEVKMNRNKRSVIINFLSSSSLSSFFSDSFFSFFTSSMFRRDRRFFGSLKDRGPKGQFYQNLDEKLLEWEKTKIMAMVEEEGGEKNEMIVMSGRSENRRGVEETNLNEKKKKEEHEENENRGGRGGGRGRRRKEKEEEDEIFVDDLFDPSIPKRNWRQSRIIRNFISEVYNERNEINEKMKKKKEEEEEEEDKKLFNKNEENKEEERNRIFSPTLFQASSSSSSSSSSFSSSSSSSSSSSFANFTFSDSNFHNFSDELMPSSSSSSSSSSFSFENYESMSSRPRYCDLLHDEARRLEELYHKKCDLDRRLRWMKMNGLPNPEKEAKLILRHRKEENYDFAGSSSSSRNSSDCSITETEEGAKEEALKMFPKPYLDESPDSARLRKMKEMGERQELVNKLRSDLRKDKLANAAVMKKKMPKVRGIDLDPIDYHIKRRSIRVGVILQEHIEQFLTWNSPTFLYNILGGIAVSIHHIEMKTTRSVCNVYYLVLPSSSSSSSSSSSFSSSAQQVDEAEIQRRMDKAAPTLRRQLANKLQLGFTPEIRFVRQMEGNLFDKSRLQKIQKEKRMTTTMRRKRAENTMNEWKTGMNGRG